MREMDTVSDIGIWCDRLSRWGISIIFLAAALPKLFDIQYFSQVINAYGILPSALILPVAVSLPLLEIVLAVGLLFNSSLSKIGVFLLLLFFIAILLYAIYTGLDIDCGCFGPEDPEHQAFAGVRVALVRDLIMLVPIMYSFWYQRYYKIKHVQY